MGPDGRRSGLLRRPAKMKGKAAANPSTKLTMARKNTGTRSKVTTTRLTVAVFPRLNPTKNRAKNDNARRTTKRVTLPPASYRE